MEENLNQDLIQLKQVLLKLCKKGKIKLAYLFGSAARGDLHPRSDLDLAVYIEADEKQTIEIENQILVSTARDIHLLRLDNEEESPIFVQEALKGIPLIEPDLDSYYKVAHWALHEAESLRFRRKWYEEAE